LYIYYAYVFTFFLAIFGRSNAFFCSFLLIIVVVLKNVAVLTTMYHQFAEDWVPTAGFLSLKKTPGDLRKNSVGVLCPTWIFG
jgi:hypothetical protein